MLRITTESNNDSDVMKYGKSFELLITLLNCAIYIITDFFHENTLAWI